MLKSSLILVVFTFSIFSPALSQRETFDINGRLSGYPDGTPLYLYLNEGHEARLYDSAKLREGTFRFTGSLPISPMHAILRIHGEEQSKYFWLENSTITIVAIKGQFRAAVITGSVTQREQDTLDSMPGKETEKTIRFIREHPNSVISVSILDIYASTWGKDTASQLYKMLTPQMQHTTSGQSIHTFITLNKNPKVGEMFIDFTSPDTTGRDIHLANFKGKVMLLDFWGSWCGPCRENNASLVELYRQFSSKGFEIIGVASDASKAEWIKAIREDRLTWTNVSDLKGWNNVPAIIYGVSKYPSNFLIDKNGIIVATDIHGDMLRTKLHELLN